MQWIISIAGIAVLFLLALAVRRPARPTYRDTVLDDALGAHLMALASRSEGKGRSRIKMSRRLLRSLEHAMGYLNTLSSSELLPAANWLCDNGRFLQEEIVSVGLALKQMPSLPRSPDGLPRICVFAREFLGHSAASLTRERFEAAVKAWQSIAPFTVEEIDSLPAALRLTLLELLCELAETCAREQSARSSAIHMNRLIRHDQTRRAMRLFNRHKHEPAFLERLLSEVREDGETGQALWLDQYFSQHALSADVLAQTEHDHQTECSLWVSNAVTSLRTISRMPWYRVLESMSLVHRALCGDRTYQDMDMESRAYYRERVGRIARLCGRTELAVCESAFALGAEKDGVRSHVGYYLIDDGLLSLFRYLRSLRLGNRVRLFAVSHACGLLRTAIWLVFVALIAILWRASLSPLLWLPVALIFLYTIQQMGIVMMTRRLKPRLVPRIELERLTDETQTLVVCPTMLLNAQHALSMVKHLSVLHQANPDTHLHFLLLGDFQDSLTGTLSGDEEIISTASAAIRALCEDTGHPFFYMQRDRAFSARDHLYMSRERKRGNIETLLKLIEGRTIQDSFAYSTLPIEQLKGQYRYVITLDSDTLLPPGSALRLVGAMLHPLQRRQELDGRMRGVSVIQPRMETAAHTVSSTLSLLLGGQGGTDPYNTPVADLAQDVYRHGTFMGKGIIDPKSFLEATENAVISGSVLSHDLLEGELSGCAMASDITLYDGHPKTLKGFLFRLHRWTRGDWQLLPYVFPLFPRAYRSPKGVLDSIGKHKIWQNLLRSLVSPLRVLLLVYAVGSGSLWLFLCLLLLPELPYLIPLSPHSLAGALCRLAVLPCEACMQADAVARTLYRLWFSRRHLLEWTTAAQASRPSDKPPMLFFYMSMLSGAAIAASGLLPGSLLIGGIAVGAWWAALPFVLPFLEQPPYQPQRPTSFMREVLGRLAKSTLAFYETAITDSDHALPPDNIQIEPNKGISHRTSPTNIGMYLCSLVASEKLRLLSPEEMAERMDAAISTLETLPKWNGLAYNWYDTQTLQPLDPPFVSSVDSGNLAVSLLTCAQGVRILLPELSASHRDLAARMDALAERMRFQALFDPEAELFWVGIHSQDEAPTVSHYDLLASESRLLSFVSIMLGQIPVRHWYRLGRLYAHTRGGQTLLSYSGTMFEYMMPLLFHPPIHGTLLEKICQNAFKEQRRHRFNGVFGVSESGYYSFDPNLFYQYQAFGVPELSLDSKHASAVVAPYASLLCMPLNLKAAFRNLLRLQALGMEGPLGMFEAVDLDPSRTDGQPMRIVRSHMAHHQGMILCAICNALEENYIAHLFFDLPRAQAYRLLLEERFSRGCGRIRHPLKRGAKEHLPPSPCYKRTAEPMGFPIDAHLLYGAKTTLMIDAQGGGYLSRNGIMLTRFHESCHLPSGLRLYLRDSQSGAYWNVTDPALTHTVSFETAQAVFTHERYEVEGTLRVFVNPLDGTALHCLTLKNQSPMERMMEVCSYLEPVLAPQRDDAAHPVFQNLFIRTERMQKYGVIAVRRPRREDEEERQLWHILSTDASLTMFRVQTDRTAFLGRGRTIYAPRALELPISAMADTLGDMIEPCLSLRGQFVLPPNGQLQFAFATLMPMESEKLTGFHERYSQVDNALRGYEPAFTQSIVTARYLGLTAPMQIALSRLTGSLCYTGQPAQFRYAAESTQPLKALWSLGISGELPILLVECQESKDLSLVQLSLKAHALYRMNGFWIDLVLATTQPTGYGHPLRDQLNAMVQSCHSHALIGKEGGIHLFDSLTEAQLALLRAAARIVLTTQDGSLADQLHALEQSSRGRPLYMCRPSAAWKSALPDGEALLFDNGYGGFTRSEGNYQITLAPGRQTPAPWCNPLCSKRFGTLASESGLVFSYANNSHSGRLTRWPNDSVTARGEESFFLRDGEHHLLWSVTRQPLGHGLPVRVTHAPGQTIYESSGYGIFCRLLCFTDDEAPAGVRVLHIKNEDKVDRTLTLLHTCIFSMGTHPTVWQLTTLTRGENGLYAVNPDMDGVACLAAVDPPATLTTTMSSGAYQGLWGVAPTALSVSESLPSDAGNTGVLSYTLQLSAGETRTITTALAFDESREKLDRALAGLRQDGASLRLHTVLQEWEERLGVFRFDLPDPAMGVMLSRWLPYQVWASRLWMRAGFYQAGGAYGFRDQLQDMLALIHTRPSVVRSHLLLCAAHQFEEGDVQHWWHPPYEGVRTRISDDKLFLPYVAALYIEATEDTSLLRESVAYLHGEPLREDEWERFFTPEVSDVSESFQLHCLRAIDHVAYGPHGLPLMGGGDWNDGMNRVGGERGESVWLGMFLCEVLRLFAPMCEPVTSHRLLERRNSLLLALDRYAWDGAWYLRGWYDDGGKLGSASSNECRIDLLSQSWAVLCGASRDRCVLAMDSAWRMLYERDIGLIKLFTPPFNGDAKPGYISGYLPGIRENGGQYTHAACWAIAALHQLGQDNQAWELANAILPVHHARTRQLAARYRVEPYAMASDIYSNPQQRGRGGWTWYTGSASWFQFVMLTQLFGFQKTGNILRFRPVVPTDWEGFRITYRYGTATYHLRASRDCPFPVADGEQLRDGRLILKDDGRIHEAIFPLRR